MGGERGKERAGPPEAASAWPPKMPWHIAVVVWTAGLGMLWLATYVSVSMLCLFREQWQMKPRDDTSMRLLSYQVAPEGSVYRVTSTSLPTAALHQETWTHRPVAFGRREVGEATWEILVPSGDTRHRQEIGAYLRNAEGYWVHESPMVEPSKRVPSEEWTKRWGKCELVPAAGASFAEAVRR